MKQPQNGLLVKEKEVDFSFESIGISPGNKYTVTLVYSPGTHGRWEDDNGWMPFQRVMIAYNTQDGKFENNPYRAMYYIYQEESKETLREVLSSGGTNFISEEKIVFDIDLRSVNDPVFPYIRVYDISGFGTQHPWWVRSISVADESGEQVCFTGFSGGGDGEV